MGQLLGPEGGVVGLTQETFGTSIGICEIPNGYLDCGIRIMDEMESHGNSEAESLYTCRRNFQK